MVKSELVRAVNEKVPELQEKYVEFAVTCILKEMENALAKGERIEIRGLGSFEVRHRPPRLAHNPKTGEAINLPAKTAVHFKPGKDMRARVNSALIKRQPTKLS